MRDIYEKLNEADETYTVEVEDVFVEVDGLAENEDSRYSGSAQVSFDIDIDFRSWGIKDISIIPRDRVNFEFEIVDAEGNVVDTLEVDFDFVDVDWKIGWTSGSGYAIDSLEVLVNRDGTVKNVELIMYYPGH